MKTIIMLFVFINPILSNCLSNNTSDPIVKITLRGVYCLPENRFLSDDSIIYFLIDLEIINNLDEYCDFITYDCAAGANLVIESKNLKVCANNCGSNSIKHVRLQKHEIFTLPIIMAGNRYDNVKDVRLGWILTTDYDNFRQAAGQRGVDNVNVIWSNKIKLSNSGGDVYKISE